MEDPTPYISDGSFHETTTLTPGNIICYYDSNNAITHSAIIVSIDNSKNGLSAITVESKWGMSGLYRHTADYCYYANDAMHDFSYTKVYAKHNHSYTDHYIKHSDTQHKAYCSCGAYRLASHVIPPESSHLKFATCSHCKALVDTSKLHGIWILSNRIILSL